VLLTLEVGENLKKIDPPDPWSGMGFFDCQVGLCLFFAINSEGVY